VDKWRVIHKIELSTILSTGLSTVFAPLVHRFIHRQISYQLTHPTYISSLKLFLSTARCTYPRFLWISATCCRNFLHSYPQVFAALWVDGGKNRHSMPISRYNFLALGEGVWDHLLLLTCWVISCIWEKTSRSLFMRLAIFAVACMTVEWSRPPKAFPILGSDSSVSSRERYMATCLG
jgi:hypothetical protein